MFQMKKWISYLKYFDPVVVSVSESQSLIKKVAYITDDSYMKNNALYVGRVSQVAYRFYSLSGNTLFLVNDRGYKPDDLDFGNNTVIIFPEKTNLDELYEKCKDYLLIQEKVSEYNQRLMSAFVSAESLQSILDCAAEIIENPLMVIDNGYRVICTSNNIGCDDLQWKECIATGYCSLEFVAQFNKLNEIQAIQKETSPVLAGCMMSPMRRCICKMFVDQKSVGYLLAIEADHSFDEAEIEILETIGKLISKIRAFFALKSGQDIYHSTWDALINAIEGLPGSSEILKDYVKNSGLRDNSQYYLMLINVDADQNNDYKIAPVYNYFRDIFPFSVFSYYKNDVLLIIDFQEERDGILEKLKKHEDFLAEKNFKVTVSDKFTEFHDMGRYYDQIKKTEKFMDTMNKDANIGFYDEFRTYDMLVSECDPDKIPLYFTEKELQIFEYDEEHGTEFFKTLYAYIKNSKSLQDTADELFIHKNTVSYRIGRIKEMFDVDLNDANVRIGLYMAYQFIELRKCGWKKEES